jgi:hypothetical protein
MADGLGGNYEPNQRVNHGQGESVPRQRKPSSFERESEENHPKTAHVGPGPLSGDRAYWAQRIGNQQMPERAPGSKRGFHHSMVCIFRMFISRVTRHTWLKIYSTCYCGICET